VIVLSVLSSAIFQSAVNCFAVFEQLLCPFGREYLYACSHVDSFLILKIENGSTAEMTALPLLDPVLCVGVF